MTPDEFEKNTLADGFVPGLQNHFAMLPKEVGLGCVYCDFCAEIIAAIKGENLPLQICHGDHRAANNGYGIKHILISHGTELAEDGFFSVQDFVLEATDRIDAVLHADKGRWSIVRDADSELQKHRILIVSRHKSGSCYEVITGYTRDGWRKVKGVLVWERRDRSPRPGKT